MYIDEDFSDISPVLMFSPSGTSRMCSAIIIMGDNLLEDSEFFTVALSSPLQDSDLNFSIAFTTVTINDTSCKYIILHNIMFT